ncbi:MAG: cell division topological specificity factor MinE [Bacillota bacterium]
MGFFNFGKKKQEASKNIAKERLQFILVQDRINLSPQEMEDMKTELLEVLSKYLEVDDEKIKMEVNRKDEMMAMEANFPLK